eukprot:scaffold3970_cov257-Pinguiococcus_pyrenoidosus.AAC.4
MQRVQLAAGVQEVLDVALLIAAEEVVVMVAPHHVLDPARVRRDHVLEAESRAVPKRKRASGARTRIPAAEQPTSIRTPHAARHRLARSGHHLLEVVQLRALHRIRGDGGAGVKCRGAGTLHVAHIGVVRLYHQRLTLARVRSAHGIGREAAMRLLFQ